MLNPGDILERRYQIVKLVGAGGMSNIYLCRIVGDPGGPERYWVVKEMSVHYQDPSEQATAVELFLREGELLQRLDHRNLPKVIDRFVANGKYHFVMEYVDGEDLGKLIARNPQGLPENMVLPWAVEVATVLYYLHCQSPPIVFRDMKPSNIMISRGTVKLIDFGIARSFKPNKKKDTISIGSPGYAPPEQYSGQTDPRSDIYALGATMHHLLTGRDPTETRTPFKFESVHLLKPSISDGTSAIITKATELDPSARYQNALDMKKALQTVAGIHTRPVSKPFSALATTLHVAVPSAAEAPHRGPTGTTSISPLSPDATPAPAPPSPAPAPPAAAEPSPAPAPPTPATPTPPPVPPRPPLRIGLGAKVLFCVVLAVGARLDRQQIHAFVHSLLHPRSTPQVTLTSPPRSGPLAPALLLLDGHQARAAADWLADYGAQHPDDLEAAVWYQDAMAEALGPTIKVDLAPADDEARHTQELRGALLALTDINSSGGCSVANSPARTCLEVRPDETAGAIAAVGDADKLTSTGPTAIALTPRTDAGPAAAPSLEACWKALGNDLTRHKTTALTVVTAPDQAAPTLFHELPGVHVTDAASTAPLEGPGSGAVLLAMSGPQLGPAAARALQSLHDAGVWSLDPQGADLPDGLQTVSEWAEDPQGNPEAYAFALHYRDTFKSEPTVWAHRTYEALHMVLDGLSSATAATAADEADAIKKSAQAPTPSPWYVLKLQKGNWVLAGEHAVITRVLLYLMGGLAGTMLGAGVALHLVREDGLAEPLAGAFTGCVIAAFLGLAHLLARTVVEDDRDVSVPLEAGPAVPRPAPCTAWLIPFGSQRGAHPLSKSCTLIGRDVENDVVINSTSMSRSHAQIVRMEGTYLVLDLDSKNGTFVNGERIVQKQLHDGDELMLGSVQFRLRIEDFDGRREESALPLGAETAPVRGEEWGMPVRDEAPPPRREEWGTTPGSRRKEEWGTTSGGRRKEEWGSTSGSKRREAWGSESWTAAARENFRREADRRRTSPFDTPFPPERERRSNEERRQEFGDTYPPDRDRRRPPRPDDPTDYPPGRW